MLFILVAADILGMEMYSSALQLENALFQSCNKEVPVKVIDLSAKQLANQDTALVAAGVFKDTECNDEQLLNMLSRFVARVSVPNFTFFNDWQLLNIVVAVVTAPIFGMLTLIRLLQLLNILVAFCSAVVVGKFISNNAVQLRNIVFAVIRF